MHRERVLRRGVHATTDAENMKNVNFKSLYFDGKRDVTLVNLKDGDKYYKKKIQEEHISILCEPNSKYIGHFTPSSGSALSIYQGIIKFLMENNINLDSISAIGCDGTNVNTGTKGGIIRLLEKSLRRPLHWFVCMLHGNELPLRHLFSVLDGKTSGPRCFTGPIGKLLALCETRSIVAFDPIHSSPLQIERTDLSADQQYLLDIFMAIREGTIPDDLAKRSPGNLNHARWLTTGSRILRLYVSTEDPTDNLRSLAKFVMEVYAPMWFLIKSNPYVEFGPRHICTALSLIRKQPEEIARVVFPVLQRNSYFAHSDNILLSMLTDEKPQIRELA